jgi:hypothetical protein
MIVRIVVLKMRFVDWRALGRSGVFKEFVPFPKWVTCVEDKNKLCV